MQSYPRSISSRCQSDTTANGSSPRCGIACRPLCLAFCALLVLALHNLVDFNWQIPANAATWIALGALALKTDRT